MRVFPAPCRTLRVLSRTQPASWFHARSFGTYQRQCSQSNYDATSTSSTRYRPLGQVLRLPSGRDLGFHTSGEPEGIPVIYIHSVPDTGVAVVQDDFAFKLTKKLGLRWIGPDRPGIGLSSAYDEQEITHYPQDIQHLVDHLSLKEYYIIGKGGGACFALACAKDLPQSQLKGLAICGGIGPVECGFESMGEMSKSTMDMWRDCPEQMHSFMDAYRTDLAQAADSTALRAEIEALNKLMFVGDELEYFSKEESITAMVREERQMYAQGAGGIAKDYQFNVRHWGFDVKDVKFPRIQLWYGEDAVNGTPTMGKYLHARLPQSSYHECKTKSPLNVWDEENLENILNSLLYPAAA